MPTLRILTICAVIYVAFLASTVLLPPYVPGPPAHPSLRTTLTRISENGFAYVEKNEAFRTIEGLVVYEDDVPLGPSVPSLTEVDRFGLGRYAQENGLGVVFSTRDNSDPRTNSRTYRIKPAAR